MTLNPGRIFRTSWPVVVVVLGGVGSGWRLRAEDTLEHAPRPNPASPVDYIAWLTQSLEPGPGADTASDAAVKYASAAASLSRIEDHRALDRASSGPWKDLPAVRAWLSANRPSLDALREGAQLQECHLVLRAAHDPPGGARWQPALLNAVVSGLGAFQPGVMGLLAEGWGQWEAGDQDKIFDSALVAVTIGHHLERARPMVARVLSLRMLETGYSTLLGAVALSPKPEERAASLVVRLADADPPLTSLKPAYLFEQLTAWDVLQRAYTAAELSAEAGLAAGAEEVYKQLALSAQGSAPPWEEARRLLAGVGFQDSVLEADDYFEALLAWLNEPYHQALGRVVEFEERAAALKNPMLRLLVSRATEAQQQHARVVGMQRGTHLAVRLLRFRSENGRFPQGLDELSQSTYIDPWRIDPYSGADFVYVLTRTSFVLYSVGSDVKDDGGRPFLPGTEAGDLVIWPVRR